MCSSGGMRGWNPTCLLVWSVMENMYDEQGESIPYLNSKLVPPTRVFSPPARSFLLFALCCAVAQALPQPHCLPGHFESLISLANYSCDVSLPRTVIQPAKTTANTHHERGTDPSIYHLLGRFACPTRPSLPQRPDKPTKRPSRPSKSSNRERRATSSGARPPRPFRHPRSSP